MTHSNHHLDTTHAHACTRAHTQSLVSLFNLIVLFKNWAASTLLILIIYTDF